MKILIAVPTFENITPDTFRSIYNLDKGEHECIFEFVRGYDCATARNRIAQMSLDKGVDYVLMVDNDVTLPSDVLLNMLEDAKDVCLGYYAHRNADNMYTGRVSICKLTDDEGNTYFNYPWYDWVNYADDHRGMLSEDLYFCELCRRGNIPIYTDSRAGCGHLLRHIQMPV